MFRFTIRDVLWLTVVVGLAVAWWADRSRLRASYKTLHTIYSMIVDTSNVAVERMPNGEIDIWTGPRKGPDGTFAYPKTPWHPPANP